MRLRAETRVFALLGPLLSMAACSSDLFHSTSWQTKCEVAPASSGCPTAASSSGTGGAGGIGGGATMSGGGGSGGTSSGGSDGGTCYKCSDVIEAGASPNQLCHNGSDDIYTALHNCVCGQPGCAPSCATDACVGQMPSSACQMCVQATCANQWMNCLNDK